MSHPKYSESDVVRMQTAYEEIGKNWPLRQPEHPELKAAWDKAYDLQQQARSAMAAPFQPAVDQLAKIKVDTIEPSPEHVTLAGRILDLEDECSRRSAANEVTEPVEMKIIGLATVLAHALVKFPSRDARDAFIKDHS